MKEQDRDLIDLLGDLTYEDVKQAIKLAALRGLKASVGQFLKVRHPELINKYDLLASTELEGPDGKILQAPSEKRGFESRRRRHKTTQGSTMDNPRFERVVDQKWFKDDEIPCCDDPLIVNTHDPGIKGSPEYFTSCIRCHFEGPVVEDKHKSRSAFVEAVRLEERRNWETTLDKWAKEDALRMREEEDENK